MTSQEMTVLLREALWDMPTCPHSRHGCCDDIMPGSPKAWCSTCQVALVLRSLEVQRGESPIGATAPVAGGA